MRDANREIMDKVMLDAEPIILPSTVLKLTDVRPPNARAIRYSSYVAVGTPIYPATVRAKFSKTGDITINQFYKPIRCEIAWPVNSGNAVVYPADGAYVFVHLPDAGEVLGFVVKSSDLGRKVNIRKKK